MKWTIVNDFITLHDLNEMESCLLREFPEKYREMLSFRNDIVEGALIHENAKDKYMMEKAFVLGYLASFAEKEKNNG